MKSLARKYWKDKDKIAKLTSYGSYLDCEYITAKYPEDESHIVGDLAEYVYDLEQKIEEQCEEIVKIKDVNSNLNELLGTKGKDFYVVEKTEYDKMVAGAKQFANQTAIKELEKVKEFARKRIEQLNGMEDKTISVIATGLACVWFIDQIDRQIAELKGGKQ